MKKSLLSIWCLMLVSPGLIADTKNEAALKSKIVELERRVQDCQKKKLALLQRCDSEGCLQRICDLQGYVNNCEQDRLEKHREISALQRTIAEHNRKLLSSMSPENKKVLRQLLREYAKFYQELCKYNKCQGRQPDAFELFFV